MSRICAQQIWISICSLPCPRQSPLLTLVFSHVKIRLIIYTFKVILIVIINYIDFSDIKLHGHGVQLFSYVMDSVCYYFIEVLIFPDFFNINLSKFKGSNSQLGYSLLSDNYAWKLCCSGQKAGKNSPYFFLFYFIFDKIM